MKRILLIIALIFALSAPASAVVTYREDGAWGSGKGTDLLYPELDGNFYTLVQGLASADALIATMQSQLAGTTDGVTLDTPTIADFTNAGHTHAEASTGGTVAHTALTVIGSNTHAQIDTHVTAGDAHITAGDSHIAAANPHSDSASDTDLTSHTSSTANPHSVTSVQAGAVTDVSSIFALVSVSAPSADDAYSVAGYFYSAPQSSLSGGGVFAWQAGLNKNTANGGTIIDPDNIGGFDGTFSTLSAFLTAQGGGVGSGCWVRLFSGPLDITWFGADPTGTDDATDSWDAMESSLAAQGGVNFPPGTYTGNFDSLKALNISGYGATLVNAVDGEGILTLGPTSFDEHAVTEVILDNGDTTFTVVGASGLFSAGDIGHLWDSSERSDSSDVNFETIRIKSISTDIITVSGFIASNKSAGDIKFYHSTTQPVGTKVRGLKFVPTDSHTFHSLGIWGSQSVTLENIDTTNTTGNAVTIRFSYRTNTRNIKPKDPKNVGSGQGYGVAHTAVTQYLINGIQASGTRHAVDLDSCYHGIISDIEEMDGQLDPVVIAHNGFGSYTTVRGVRVSTSQSAVSSAESGFLAGGAVVASKEDHPIRNVTIEDVTNVYTGALNGSSAVPGVYLRNNVDNVRIQNIKVQSLSADTIDATCFTTAVRVNGIAIGPFVVDGITGDKMGRFVHSNGDRNGATLAESPTVFNNLHADEMNEPLLMQGHWRLSVDNISVGSAADTTMIDLASISSDHPQYFHLGTNVRVPATSQIYAISATVPGEAATRSTLTNTNLLLTDSTAISAADLQQRDKYMRISSNSTTASPIDITAWPDAYVNGHIVEVHAWNTGLDDVRIPSTLSNVSADITFDSTTPTRRLIWRSGNWTDVDE